MHTLTHSLDGMWTLQSRRLAAGAPVENVRVPATVPGSVHLDLLAAGVIADPFVDTNETLQYWVGESDWELSRHVTLTDLAPGERVELVFHGLDTVATVLFDDHVLGATENMHRTYRFDITELLLGDRAEHALTVRFASPVDYAVARRDTHGDLPNPYQQPYNFIRKMACNFGWDWGPRLVGCGIWQNVELQVWDDFIIDEAFYFTRKISEEVANLVCQYSYRSDIDGPALEMECRGTGDDLEIAEPRKVGDDVLGQAVRKVFVRLGALIGERENGEHWFG